MKRTVFPLWICMILGIALSPLSAQTFKIGSIAPQQSPWGNALNRLAAEWKQISGGRITLRIYHGGTAGEEQDMIRKIKIGQLQGAALTNLGLASVSQDTLSLSVPLLIRDTSEFDYVFPRVRPNLDEDIEKNGFRVIAWSNAGWLRFFSKAPIYSPDDLKKQTLASADGEDQLLQAWRALGYDAVPVPITQILTGLNSGLVDALYASPIAAGGFQWFGVANHMTDLPIAPFTGAILLSNAAWRRIPSDLRPALTRAAEQITRDLDRNIRELEEEAVSAMKSYGLQVHELSSDQTASWQQEIEDSYSYIIGTIFPEEMFRLIEDHLRKFRRQ